MPVISRPFVATLSLLLCHAAGAGAPAEPVTMHVKSADGTRITFDRWGNGPALILVTGALADRSGGAELARLLAPNYTVYSYDRRGRGGSTDTKPYSVRREIEDLEALITTAGGTAFVYGKSSGASLALQAAAALGGKVRKLAIYEPPYDDAEGAARNGRKSGPSSMACSPRIAAPRPPRCSSNSRECRQNHSQRSRRRRPGPGWWRWRRRSRMTTPSWGRIDPCRSQSRRRSPHPHS